MKTEIQVREEIEDKKKALEHYELISNVVMARIISIQLSVLSWIVGEDGNQYTQHYDDIPF